MIRQQREQNFNGRSYDAAARHMSAEHAAFCIGYGHVQMRAVGCNRPCKRQDLQVGAQFGRLLDARESQLRDTQAADALNDERRRRAERAKRLFDCVSQILSGVKA
jgi:hypothetical protein